MTHVVRPFSVSIMSTERIEIDGELLTRAEAAQKLKVSIRTVERYIEKGKLPSVVLPVGRRVRIPAEAVEALLQPITRTASHN